MFYSDNSFTDPLMLTEAFKSVMHANIVAHSAVGCPCRVGYTYISLELSLISGKYFNFSGIWEPINGLYMTIPIDEEGFTLNGKVIDGVHTPLTVTITRPGQQSFFSFPKPYRALVFFVNYEKYKYHYEAIIRKPFDEGVVGNFMQFRSYKAKQDFLSEVLPMTKEAFYPSFDVNETDLLVTSLIEKFILSMDAGSYDMDRSYCDTLAIRVYSYIVSNKVEQITLTKLCEVMKASSRSIQKGFNNLYGMGPIEFDRIFRLQKLRRHIKKHGLAHGELTTLMGVFGFSHAGRLSQNYRKMFGVLPSKDTIFTNDIVPLKGLF